MQQLEKRIIQLERHYQADNSTIKELNTSYISQESKRIDWERQQQNLKLQNSVLEKSVREKDTTITELIREITSMHNTSKLNNISLSRSKSSTVGGHNKGLELKLDFGPNVNTQDTRMQTIDSMKAKSDTLQKIFSTYSDRIEKDLLTHRLSKNDKKKLQTHRQQMYLANPESPSMFKDNSINESDREINKNMMDIDDSLSDVQGQDMGEVHEYDNSMFIDESEQFLDNLGLLSPINLDISKNSDRNLNTPSFKMEGISKHTRRKARDLQNMNVGQILNFDGPLPNIPLLDL